MSQAVERQVQSLPQLFGELGEATIANAREFAKVSRRTPPRIVLCGAGDSLVASKLGATALNRAFPGTVHRQVAPAALADFIAADPHAADTTLVVAISEQGKSPDVLAALTAVRETVDTVVVTNAVDSPMASVCHSEVRLGMETGERSPGIRSFAGSLVGLMAVGAVLHDPSGAMLQRLADDCATLRVHLPAVNDVLFDSRAETIADWSTEHLPAVLTVIADGPQAGDGAFIIAKTTECCGAPGQVVDSEQWSHVTFFGNAGTAAMVLIDAETGSRGRLAASAEGSRACGVPTLVLSTDPDSAGNPEHVLLPRAHLTVLPDPTLWIAGTAAIGDLTARHGMNYFGGAFNPQTCEWNFNNPFMMAMREAAGVKTADVEAML